MKKVIVLLGVLLLLTGCVRYKIKVRPVGTTTYYTPMKRERGIWMEHYNSPTEKVHALQQIQIWKELEAQKKIDSRLQYIKIK